MLYFHVLNPVSSIKVKYIVWYGRKLKWPRCCTMCPNARFGDLT